MASNPRLPMSSAALLLLLAQGSALGQESGAKLLPSPGGQIAITAGEQRLYDDLKFAPARRAGDYVYVSGVVVIRDASAPPSPESFKAATRAAFQKLRARLQALGTDFPDVVMINTFHDWSAPEFHGDRWAQFEAFNAVKEEFMGSNPHPAWTAVGTSGLIRENGIVEVQMIAYAPLKGRR